MPGTWSKRWHGDCIAENHRNTFPEVFCRFAPENIYVMLLEVIDGEFVTTKICNNGFYFEGGTSNALQYLDPDRQRNVIIASIYIDTVRNVAHIRESRMFEIPSEFDYAGATFRGGGAGLNFSGYKLATETRYKGKITLENGLEYYETESVPYIEKLTHIQ